MLPDDCTRLTGRPSAAPRAVTCSSDGSIRLWNLAPGGGRTLAGMIVASANDCHPGGPGACGSPVGRAPLPGLHGGRAALPSELLRSLRVSQDGRHLAAGDERGNLRVRDWNRENLASCQQHALSALTTVALLTHQPPTQTHRSTTSKPSA